GVTANEAGARLAVERLALAAQAAALLEMDSPSAEAFIALRLRPRGMAYGAYEVEVDQRAVLERAMPACMSEKGGRKGRRPRGGSARPPTVELSGLEPRASFMPAQG